MNTWNLQLTAFLIESNQIEGIKVSAEMIELYALNPHDPVCSSEMLHARNSVRAMLYGFANYHQRMSLEILFGIHARQMETLLEDAGRYRSVRVAVGGNPCPLPAEVPKMMENWYDLYNAAPGVEPSWNPMRLHYEFEIIHPFRDGNGRVGRILWIMDRIRRGQLVMPILDSFQVNEATFQMKRDLYYDALEFHRNLKNRVAVELERASRKVSSKPRL